MIFSGISSDVSFRIHCSCINSCQKTILGNVESIARNWEIGAGLYSIQNERAIPNPHILPVITGQLVRLSPPLDRFIPDDGQQSWSRLVDPYFPRKPQLVVHFVPLSLQTYGATTPVAKWIGKRGGIATIRFSTVLLRGRRGMVLML